MDSGIRVSKHSQLSDVSTPHALADLVGEVCSDAEADAKVATGDVDKLDGYHAHQLVHPLTVAIFQINPATGDCADPQNLNDNNPVTPAIFDVVDEYAEVDFGA
ncbi:unnamed protein product, partial [marine sediment metagenome]